jgi:hypothetical protein
MLLSLFLLTIKCSQNALTYNIDHLGSYNAVADELYRYFFELGVYVLVLTNFE